MLKFIYVLKIHMKKNINFLLTKEKVQDQIILMTLKFLLNTQMK